MMKAILIAGTHSGCGKTTVTLGIMAALKARGLRVQPFKCGPDFIDAGLHRLAAGRDSRNLDLWMCGPEHARRSLAAHAGEADIAVIEGVMGLYDGDHGTAALAAALNLPVALVVDAAGLAESVGAVALGFREYGRTLPGREVKLAGVILNRVGSERHRTRLAKALRDVALLGCLPREAGFAIPHRHLGLATALEEPLSSKAMAELAAAIEANIDLDALLASAAEIAPPAQGGLRSSRKPVVNLAVAHDQAFCFYYRDNLDLLEAAGARLIFFSPLEAAALPEEADGVYIGGGYPELHAARLEANAPMRAAIAAWARAGRPLYAECGGLMYLSRGLYDTSGQYFEMCGVLLFATVMNKRLARLGYREVELRADGPFGKAGTRLRGHEFHYSSICDGLDNTATDGKEFEPTEPLYTVRDASGGELPNEGFWYKNTAASYVHLHLGGTPEAEGRFVEWVGAWKEARGARNKLLCK